MYTGYIDSQGRTYFRCPHCGDSSKNTSKCHAFRDTRGTTWCYKCETRTQLTMQQYLAVSLGRATMEEVLDEEWTPYNRQTKTVDKGRHTLLSRYVADDPTADAFAMYDKHSRLQGYHIRQPDSKHFFNEGNRGICWAGAGEGRALTSSKNRPRTLVEGPYDVCNDGYVSVFGKISRQSMKHMKGQHVIAFPDPDIIATRDGRRQFVEMLQYANDNTCWVHGLISANGDPDEATKQLYVPLARAVEIVRQEYYA